MNALANEASAATKGTLSKRRCRILGWALPPLLFASILLFSLRDARSDASEPVPIHGRDNRVVPLLSTAVPASTPHHPDVALVLATSLGGNYSTARRQEVTRVLAANLALPYLQRLIVLAEHGARSAFPILNQKHGKLRVVQLKTQPTYTDLFNAASTGATQPNQLIAVANTDIEFGPTTLACIGPSRFQDQALIYALTRHPHPDCPSRSGGGAHPSLPQNLCTQQRQRDNAWINSADTFITSAPVPSAVLTEIGHVQNRLGAENRLLYFFARAGYTVENPCVDMPTFHRHCTGERAPTAQRGAQRVDARTPFKLGRHSLPTCNMSHTIAPVK
ncbi:uncharacterized protein MONBRDRAFT_28982 [Monosiga brevicollis MX1]|uniref:Glycosyltransferase 2-like domain-containing protein n=1 Tax=Monosiga brevicollis TaxID=81824 RepID=A9V9R7_MONBE|nr:uncharacterized protein MONBRDRAFT_28982 [Monosiga brevicollis MX1]EDQ85714.1 predicted protein [Monosiga brevicollis MX1]|eukprot:XP_001749429.1 hypothetical protein [Monosiga brevicollis MX1]